MRRVDQTVAPFTNESWHINIICGLILMSFSTSRFCARLMVAPGNSMEAPLQNHSPEGYLSFLVSKTPPKSLSKRNRTMVSSSPMCDLTSQHSPWISYMNTLVKRQCYPILRTWGERIVWSCGRSLRMHSPGRRRTILM
jgi:hypothetical protein